MLAVTLSLPDWLLSGVVGFLLGAGSVFALAVLLRERPDA